MKRWPPEAWAGLSKEPPLPGTASELNKPGGRFALIQKYYGTPAHTHTFSLSSSFEVAALSHPTLPA